MSTKKELEQIEKAKASFKEIMKVHMREPFTESEFQGLGENMKKLKKYNCDLYYTEDISINREETVVSGKRLMEILNEGYFILNSPQLGIRILYVKVYGGKGMLWGKKIHYTVYQQDLDEKNWTPLGTFKIWSLAVTGINNIFRSQGLLQGSAL